MTNPAAASAKATVDIDADPATVYRLITDLRTLAELAEETSAMEWKKGDDARPGAVFVGRNRNGSRSWSTTCTVTDATPGQVFAFDVRSTVIPVAHWRYEISPTASGCRVTESTWDRRPGWFRKPAGWATGVSDRDTANAGNIAATLRRLKARAEA
ncbi:MULTISPECIES: SRPBCC family protein [Mycolicibacterium]|uniref:SRPBCC family protein n=1 Tax=Mycobacterium sp. (strain JLS) TaxID=164757 RepID=A0A5Q5CNV3_MYCSJ|nr:SRPBCC family protein [Mycolicibacterium monacense]OBB69190.1 polyketide cyclase [Mycolicibacterium monacense]